MEKKSAVRRLLTEKARMGAQYGADPRDRQGNEDGRALNGIAEAVRELRDKGWSLRMIAKSVGMSTASAGHTCDTTNTRQLYQFMMFANNGTLWQGTQSSSRCYWHY